MRKVGYLAVDQGPRQALAALQSLLPGPWLDADRDDRSGGLRAQGIELLICGTSDTTAGRQAEARARIEAQRRGLPCVVIEDFPGNYYEVAGAPPRLIVVENEFAARLARAKAPSVRVEAVPAVRYDPLRRRLGALRERSEGEDAALWIGQPETDDSVETLRRILPALGARGMRVWLRAHPRDAGYRRGAYAAMSMEDLTARPLEECLARRPRLVITQFSSAAIEAGFWEIPALNVLFDDVGGKTLAAKKGYPVPPWCEAGAAFVITRMDDVPEVLDRALGAAAARRAVVEAFDRYFEARSEGVPELINLLYNQGLL
jgi:hypothetical protein